jgi:hypothetical protein
MSWLGQASEHEADHSETDEGCRGSRIALEIARKSSVAADPGEGSLDNPSLGQDDEAMQIIALDDLKCPGAGLGDGRGGLGFLVAAALVGSLKPDSHMQNFQAWNARCGGTG